MEIALILTVVLAAQFGQLWFVNSKAAQGAHVCELCRKRISSADEDHWSAPN